MTTTSGSESPLGRPGLDAPLLFDHLRRYARWAADQYHDDQYDAFARELAGEALAWIASYDLPPPPTRSTRAVEAAAAGAGRAPGCSEREGSQALAQVAARVADWAWEQTHPTAPQERRPSAARGTPTGRRPADAPLPVDWTGYPHDSSYFLG